ncbi:MAG: 50S ribosomal protein L6 [bacterium]|nr:50S ribosomal protein L6 [bacterium]
MSKIGKQPVLIPAGTTVTVTSKNVKITGPKGTLSRTLPREVDAKVDGEQVMVTRKGNSKTSLAMHGTWRSLINNMVNGVSKGWTRQLELVGTGFRADTTGKSLNMIVGYSHPVKIEAPEGITFKVEKMIITVEGIDREVVGQTAANIREVRPPEPYKGKGVKYVEEVIRRKAGKAAAKATTA